MRYHLTREEQKEIKNRWSEQYQELEVIVNRWDPVGLIRGGAPKDEYDCLTTQLLALLHKGATPEVLKNFIVVELNQHFGYGISNMREEYQERFNMKCSDFSEKIVNWYGSFSYSLPNENNSPMNIGFVALETFIPTNKYLERSKLFQVEEVVSLDSALCPRIIKDLDYISSLYY